MLSGTRPQRISKSSSSIRTNNFESGCGTTGTVLTRSACGPAATVTGGWRACANEPRELEAAFTSTAAPPLELKSNFLSPAMWRSHINRRLLSKDGSAPAGNAVRIPLPREEGNAASIKSREATEEPQTGWSSHDMFQNAFAKDGSGAITPSVPFRNGGHSLMARPPLLCE